MARHEVTRRRALALGAAAGLGALLGPPAYARRSSASFTAQLPEGAFGDVVRPGRRFDLVGVRGAGPAAGLQLRARRRGGPWSRWTAVRTGTSHGPDAARGASASDPIWTGHADELQLRARGRRPAGPLVLEFVAVGDAPAIPPRAHAAQSGAPPIITRDQWGARPSKQPPSYGSVDLAFIHHTDNANTYTAAQSAGIVLAIQRYHQDHNGWNDIGYNFLVDRYGQVFEGRVGGIDQAVIGAQAQGWNSHSTGIATIGTFVSAGFPDEGMAVLARLVAWKLALHGVPATGTVAVTSGGGAANRYPYGRVVELQRVSGHRDGCSTDCPGAVLYGQLDTLRARAAGLQGTIVTRPRMSLSAARSRVPYGDDAVFTGKLLGADGVPVAGARVSLQKQGRSGWVTVQRATTADDGSFRAAVAWRRSGAVRARADVSGVSEVIRSPQVAVAVVPRLAIASPEASSRVKAGGSVAVAGSVRPGGAVRVVVERHGRDGRWHRVQAPLARVRGQAFRLAVRLRTPGLYRIHARTAGAHTAPVFVRAVRSAGDIGGVAAEA